jgi:hypothetical protein
LKEFAQKRQICIGLQKVLAKIEGLNIFDKTLWELQFNKPKLLLPMVTISFKVKGHRLLSFSKTEIYMPLKNMQPDQNSNITK